VKFSLLNAVGGDVFSETDSESTNAESRDSHHHALSKELSEEICAKFFFVVLKTAGGSDLMPPYRAKIVSRGSRKSWQ
jgi:hypothetical protein